MVRITKERDEQHIHGVLTVNDKVVTFLNGKIYEAVDLTDAEIKAVEDYLKKLNK